MRPPTTITDPHGPRMSGQHLNDIEIAKVLGLAKAGKSQREIARLMHCSQKPVYNTLTNYDFQTFQGHDQRCEYKRKTTAREDRYIERALKRNESLPLKDITNIVNQNVTPISRITLGRRRSEAGLGSYVAASKPGLRIENVEKRLQWALEHRN